jgi:hypothetical protein
MGSEYVYGNNPFRDFLLESIMINVDISTKEAKRDIDSAFKYILGNILINRDEIVYLDFEIIKNEEHYKIQGKNSISALWLSGFFPSDGSKIIKSTTFIIGNKKYVFNKETNELTYTTVVYEQNE